MGAREARQAVMTTQQQTLEEEDDYEEEGRRRGEEGTRQEDTAQRDVSVCAIQEEDAMSCEPTLMAGVAENNIVSEKTEEGHADEDYATTTRRRRRTENVDTVEAGEEDNALETVVGEVAAMHDVEPTPPRGNATTVKKNDAEGEEG